MCQNKMKIRYTNHCAKRLIERGISRRVINSLIKTAKSKGKLKHMIPTILLETNTNTSVTVKREHNNIIVITCYAMKNTENKKIIGYKRSLSCC